MKVLHLLSSGGVGGIEVLMKEYSLRTKTDSIFLFARKGGIIEEEMKNKGVTTIVLGEDRYKFNEIIERIIAICKGEQIDVVVSHYPDPLIRLAAIKAKNKCQGIKMVFYAHSNANDMYLDCNQIKRAVKRSIQKKAIKMADNVIAVSKSVKNSLIQDFKAKPESIQVVYNGIPLEQFAVKTEEFNTDLRLIYVGRLIEEKGVQNTLNGLRYCKTPYYFSVVGDGEYRKQLEALAEGMNVKFLGTRTDIPELLASSDVFVHLPQWEEGFGITVVEALAAGKICICGEKGALPEIITDGENGFMLKDPQELMGVLERIRNMNAEEISRMQKNARVSAAKYSINYFTDTMDEVLAMVTEA